MNTIYVLAFATLGAVVAIGGWQLVSVKRSKANRGEPEGQVAAPPANVTSPTRAPLGPKPGTVPPSRQ